MHLRAAKVVGVLGVARMVGSEDYHTIIFGRISGSGQYPADPGDDGAQLVAGRPAFPQQSSTGLKRYQRILPGMQADGTGRHRPIRVGARHTLFGVGL